MIVQTEVPVTVAIGDTVLVQLPYSEAAMHLQLAGGIFRVRLVDAWQAQIIDRTGRPVSFAVLPCEAGIRGDSREGFRANAVQHADYPHLSGMLYDCVACEAVCHCDAVETGCVSCEIASEKPCPVTRQTGCRVRSCELHYTEAPVRFAPEVSA